MEGLSVVLFGSVYYSALCTNGVYYLAVSTYSLSLACRTRVYAVESNSATRLPKLA